MHYYVVGVLAVSWAFWFWETYLDYRQYRVYKTTDKVPNELRDHIDEETFKKAKSYSIDKAKFGLLASIFNQLQFTVTIYYFLMPFFWTLSAKIMIRTFGLNRTDTLEWEIFQSLVFTFITSIASTIINLPVSIYSTFVIEERHGFNKQTAGFYAWDKLKKFLVSYIITAPVLAATIYIVRNGGPYFFLYLWLFCFVVVLLLILFHGEIASLFDTFTPLPVGVLRDRIEEMAGSVNFPLKSIFVVEGSKRSSHSNAYIGGFLNRRRIVIYDTLIEGYYDHVKPKSEISEDTTEGTKAVGKKNNKDDVDRAGKGGKKKGCNNDEIVAVLCHELGHWHCSHTVKSLVFAEINYFFMFLIFSKFYSDPTLYSAFGFFNDKPVLIGLALLMMILTPYNELLGFISTLMSRKFEYQADEYASKKGYADKLKTALVKLNIDNLGFPVHDELYSTFNHSHPTLIQRMKALDNNKKAN